MNGARTSLLIVDDESYILSLLAKLLEPHYEVLTAGSADAAEALIRQRGVDLILSDQRMPERTGVQLLEWVREFSPRTVRLLMTGRAELEDAIEAINRGHVFFYLLKPWNPEGLLQVIANAAEKFGLERRRDELLGELRQLNRELEQRVADRTRELQQQAEEMKRLALTDPLTGLLNRRAMDGLALAEMKRHARYHNPVALGVIDADHFGEINKTYKQTGGDAVLVELTRMLTATMRESDSVGRVGGDEFLVIARETNEEGARFLGERIREKVAATPVEHQRHRVAVTVTIGFAVAEGTAAVTYPQMYDAACAALKEAKEGGRNRCVVRRVGLPD